MRLELVLLAYLAVRVDDVAFLVATDHELLVVRPSKSLHSVFVDRCRLLILEVWGVPDDEFAT